MRIFANSPKQMWLAEKIASRPTVLLFVCFCVLAVGAAFSLLGYCTGFQRSGAVLICVAMLGIYLNHFVAKETETAQSILRDTRHLQDLVGTTDFIHRQGKVKSREDAENVAAAILQLKQNLEKSLPELSKVSSNIVALEFAAGIVGTLVWAFGDVLFCS